MAKKTSAGQPVKRADDVVWVRAREGLKRFCRAGMCFDQAPKRLEFATLGKGVLDALKAEPNLLVSGGESAILQQVDIAAQESTA